MPTDRSAARSRTHNSDPVMSSAAYARLTAMLAEGEGLDDAQPMYSPLGELRQFKAEYDRLRDALDEIDAQTSGAFTGEPQTLNRLAAIRSAIDTVKDVS